MDKASESVPVPYTVVNADPDVSFTWRGTGMPRWAVRDLAVGAAMAWNWNSPHDSLAFLNGTGLPAEQETRSMLEG